MRIPLLLFTAFVAALFFSCSSGTDINTALTGNWLVLYPDHQLKTYKEREVYGRHQDSLIGLYGLKLIALEDDGWFREIDSIAPGVAKWSYSNDSLLKIQEGGRGFNPFNTTFTGFENDTLQLTQFLPLEGEKIKVVWHLKKIGEDHEAAKLFGAEANAWRKRPVAPEPVTAMRKRLADMLNYYGDYFQLVGKEAIYFSPARVPLPFQYYQHAMGMKEQMNNDFDRLFFNEQEAQQAYQLLEQAMTAKMNDFPRRENFVTEYGLFLKELAQWMQNNFSE